MGNTSSLIAVSFFSGEVLGPLAIVIGVCAIPIMAILTRHQRQMAEIIHGRRREDAILGELEAVKAEVSELRSQLRALNPPTVPVGDPEELKRRLG
ncbi:MAG TPA: hypothetical protein VKT78_20025 [Fimbriimonadaceae bacterium]|nr:hypothetical protein [Fimbriimonadaceae bacterium]